MTTRKKLFFGLCFLLFVASSLYGGLYVKKHYRSEILSNPIVHRMIPLYRSIRKLPDIVFMPWAAFAKSNLETYELTISPQNIERMNAALPENPFNSWMEVDSKLWVSGYFRAPGYEDNVKVRYRGNLSAHWNAYQKSYIIKFPKDNLFRGMREMNLVIPSKRRYFAMSLNDYRAHKLDLIAPTEQLVRLEFNGADTGVLYAFEGWSQAWIEKMPISSLSTLYGVDEGTASYRERWDSWNAEEPIDFTPLETLTEIVEHASDEEFKKLIPQLVDLEDWYKWDILRILASGYHVSGDTTFGENNLVLIFERSEGRFKPVPYNTVIYTPSFRAMVGTEGAIGVPTKLYQRILSIPEFRAQRDAIWESYAATQKETDLAWIDDWLNTYNREFLLDNAKNDNHFMYLSKVNENAQAAQEHFSDPFNMVTATYTPTVTVKESLEFPITFKHLSAAGTDPVTAAAQHPGLWLSADGLQLSAGTYWFDQTIIIPAGTSLTIAPGATLRMKDGVSLISYSPIIAEGTSDRPITITGYDPDTKWGVFAVINAGTATSSIQYIQADNGGEDTINGAYISGMLAFHNSNVLFTNNTISRANGDDGANVKGSFAIITNNTFIENASDGIDLDYIDPSSTIENNTFTNNFGDALDISWSDIVLNQNTIDTCGDKGISVGESSRPTITNNTIGRCGMGIAIKDSSHAIITNNTIHDNETAIAAYQKKPYFSGGTGAISDNTFTNNNTLTFTDELSSLDGTDITTTQ